MLFETFGPTDYEANDTVDLVLAVDRGKQVGESGWELFYRWEDHGHLFLPGRWWTSGAGAASGVESWTHSR